MAKFGGRQIPLNFLSLWWWWMVIEIRREHGPQNTPKHIKTHKTRRRQFVPLKLSETFSNKFQNNLNQSALQGSGVPGIVLEGTLQAGRHREFFWKGACLPSLPGRQAAPNPWMGAWVPSCRALPALLKKPEVLRRL